MERITTMKLRKATVSNFASYDHLDFDFNDLELSLVYGATGSGKSTLLDIAVWILYGQTAKGGNVDEIRPLDDREEPTIGTIEVSTLSGSLFITRIRGRAAENDLYWEETPGKQLIRGKDITETQKLLNERLRMDVTTFFTSSYYCEFSPVSSFFTGTSKLQRGVFEDIADLDLPIELLDKTVKDKKTTKDGIEELKNSISNNEGQLNTLLATKKFTVIRNNTWNSEQVKLIQDIQHKADNFETIKNLEIKGIISINMEWDKEKLDKQEKLIDKIHHLKKSIKSEDHFKDNEKCITCGSISNEIITNKCKNETLKLMLKDYEDTLEKLQTTVNPHIIQWNKVKNLKNHYTDILEIEKTKVSPFIQHLESLDTDIPISEKSLKNLKEQLDTLNSRFECLEQLYDISFELRALLLRNVIKEVETSTNRYLEKHFDSEFKVQFDMENSDKLNIVIQKNGNECVFRQLSKGQRQLLKLCFGVSVMNSASNRSGVHIDTLMFDESLDGMDSELKIKAFDLFSELQTQHGSVIVIEHSSEFQELFSNKFNVVITGDVSTIKER